MTDTATIELTDTFSGEANYSWCERKTFNIDGMTDRQVERKARALIGLTGIRCKRTDFGEMVEWRPYGSCTVAFLTWDY